MSAQNYEQEKYVESEKNRTQTGHKTGHSAEPIPFPLTHKKGKQPAARSGRDSLAYWKTKVKPRTIRGKTTPELYCRLFEGKREAWICCDTSNRAEAADIARNHYLRMKAIGLPALLNELRPDIKPERVCSLSEYLSAAKALSTVRPTTLADYESALRRIYAGVLRITWKSRKVADLAEWRAKVDSVSLDRVSPTDVRAWQKRELDSALAAGGEIKKDQRHHTLASDIRDARSLFSEVILAEAGKALKLPSPHPFSGITAAATTRRFTCKVDARSLYAAASNLDADTRAAFDLLLCGGLRRGEADSLPWDHVDLAAGKVTIGVTATFRPKSRESHRTVQLPPEVTARLKNLRAANPTAELVLARRPAKAARKSASEKTPVYQYRAKAMPTLIKWLKGQGITDLNPIHALRKLSGSFIYDAHGLEATRMHLGHSNIATTAASYVKSRSVVVDLSSS